MSQVAKTIGPDANAGSILIARKRSGRNEPIRPDAVMANNIESATAAPKF